MICKMLLKTIKFDAENMKEFSSKHLSCIINSDQIIDNLMRAVWIIVKGSTEGYSQAASQEILQKPQDIIKFLMEEYPFEYVKQE